MSSLVEKAFSLASSLHASQRRKTPIVPNGERAPYLSHVIEVAGMVMATGGHDPTVAAALLHDALEDTDATYEMLVDQIGVEAADIVRECTEVGTDGPVKAPWQERKEAYLAHIAVASAPALLISVADKLQSIRELHRQVRLSGDRAYKDLVSGSIDERKHWTIWFQTRLSGAFLKRLSALYEEQAELVGRLQDQSVSSSLLGGINNLVQDFNDEVKWLSEH